MPESVLITFKLVCALAFHGVIKSKTQFALKDLKALSIDPSLDMHSRPIASPTEADRVWTTTQLHFPALCSSGISCSLPHFKAHK